MVVVFVGKMIIDVSHAGARGVLGDGVTTIRRRIPIDPGYCVFAAPVLTADSTC
jgi:hypothetical protein